MKISRRAFLASALSVSTGANKSFASSPWEIGWDDLIPPGVPYAEIIGEGEMDVANDTWNPIFDANATKLNDKLNGALVRIPGYMVPLEIGSKGVSEFILVPYVGACIHVPPPPANQLIVVTANEPWPDTELWVPVWVVGQMSTQIQTTELAQAGYSMEAHSIELYEW